MKAHKIVATLSVVLGIGIAGYALVQQVNKKKDNFSRNLESLTKAPEKEEHVTECKSNWVPDRYIVVSSESEKITCTVDGKLSINDSTISGEYHKKKEYLVTIITKNCSGVQEGACCDQDKVGVEIKTTKI